MSVRKNNQGQERRQGRLCRVGGLIARAVTPICQQNGFIQARILLEWDYIVSPSFSSFCTPVKVTFPFKQRTGGRLALRATGSMATEISYLEPHILSRINQYFGYQAISKISILQGPVNRQIPLPRKIGNPVPEETETALITCTSGIEDEGLRNALVKLGGSIAATVP